MNPIIHDCSHLMNYWFGIDDITNKIGITDAHRNIDYLDNSRIKSDDMYMALVKILEKNSHDANTGMAIVAVKDNRIIATGLNGFPSGSIDKKLPNCRVNGDSLKLDAINHAEENLICDAAKRGVSLDDTTVYISSYPCKRCARLLVSVGIKKWVVGKKPFKETEQDSLWRMLWMKMFNVNVREYE